MKIAIRVEFHEDWVIETAGMKHCGWGVFIRREDDGEFLRLDLNRYRALASIHSILGADWPDAQHRDHEWIEGELSRDEILYAGADLMPTVTFLKSSGCAVEDFANLLSEIDKNWEKIKCDRMLMDAGQPADQWIQDVRRALAKHRGPRANGAT